MRDIILFPAYNLGDTELFYSVKSINPQDILIICDTDYIREFSPKGNYIEDDFADKQLLLEKIEAWILKNQCRIAGIIAIDEEIQFRLSKFLAEKLNIIFYDNKTLNVACNKYLLKKGFDKNRILNAKYCLIGEDIPEKLGFSFPNVLKILTGNSSEFVFLNRTSEELMHNIRFLSSIAKESKDTRLNTVTDIDGTKIDSREKFLLEEFLFGEEYSCDFFIDKNTIKLIRLVNKIKSENFGYFDAFWLLNNLSAKKQGINIEDLLNIGKGIKETMMIEKGVCMADFKVQDGKISLIESTIRPGLAPFIPIMDEIYGYSSVKLFVDLLLGRDVNLKQNDAEGFVYQINGTPGKISEFIINIPERLKEDVISIHKYFDKGDIIDDDATTHHGLLAGYIVMKKKPNANIKDIIMQLKKNIILNIK